MAKLTQIEQLRRQKSRRKLTRNLLLLTLFGVVVLVISRFSGEIGKTELKAAMSDIKAEITSGSGFPVPLPAGTLKRMDAVSGALVMQTDTHLYTYNETGRQMLAYQHGMENAMISTARDRLLAYDRGGTKMHMFSRSAILQSLDSPFAIYDADMNNKGVFAVASGSDSYLAQVMVYDASFNQIFKWFSAEYPVIGVSVSEQKDAMVVGCVGAKNGAFHSQIRRFQFNMEEELANVSLKPGELLLAVDYHGAAGVRAITDSRVVLFSPELKEIAEYPFDGRQLIRFDFLADGRTLLVMQNPTGERQHTLYLLDSRLKSLCNIDVSGTLLGVSVDEEYLYLADQNRVSLYQVDGTEVKSVIENTLYGALAIDKKLYYATSAEVKMIDIRKAFDPKSIESDKNKFTSSKDISSETGTESKSTSSDPPKEEEDTETSSTEELESSEIQPDEKPEAKPEEKLEVKPEENVAELKDDQLTQEPIDEPIQPTV